MKATAEIFWAAFQALSKSEREAVVERMFQDKQFKEDLRDMALISTRRNEPSRSLRSYLAGRQIQKKR